MDSSLIELSKYRYQRSKEIIEDAKLLVRDKRFSSSVNRSYYAIFHALRAITALDSFDSSKHSGIIAYINKEYVKSGVFDKSLSKILDTSFRLREKADYDDFFMVSKDTAVKQIEKAEKVISIVGKYLEMRWK